MIQQASNNFSAIHLGIYRQKWFQLFLNEFPSDIAKEESKMSLNIASKSLRVYKI